MFWLRCQEQLITMQLGLFLNKHKKHLKKAITIDSDIKERKKRLNEEIKSILKKSNNDAGMILKYVIKHNTKVFKITNAKESLSRFGEEPGLIPAFSGGKAFVLNLALFKKLSFKTEPMFIIDDKEIDIYYLIHHFHRWYYMKNGFPGFDEKSQRLLKQVNKGKDDSIISNLKPDEIFAVQEAIARDVESITFTEQYARETAGSKKALEKIKNGLGASI